MSLFVHRAWPVRLALLAGIALAASALVAIGRAGADEGVPTGIDAVTATSVSNVPTGKADAVFDGTYACTCSPNFVNMAGMSKTFKLGGQSNQPVIVLFQGSFRDLAPGVVVSVALSIDGRRQQSATVDYREGNDHWRTHGFNFFTEPLAPGMHTATIQWRDNGVGPGHALNRSMIILHR